ncbi:hypothetical protein SLEP1_g28112 [Rubroshorea leprosula]|uniref:Cellulose synthase-like protein H1 n=1 Tax=Rubroshorea leprosula TaxID=152421 RepID=A0AAV5JYN5_9ROSI|nr:hypothetical protein SLEP1_g28112 [Rubroshorea leprosula]
MTNAPFMLNVDFDMFVNSPVVVRQGMCVLLGTNNERESAFVQFPQIFYDAPKDDPFGNQFVTLFQYLVPGIAGIQRLFYCGTGCFLRRKVIYGLWPDDEDTSIVGNLSDNGLVKEYGNSKEFLESAARALKGKIEFPTNLSNNLEAACQVAGCAYENGTDWGNKVGWIYGSTTEDILTSLIIHNKGWMTIYVAPDPPAFLGCAPSVGPVAMTQQKRWSTGLLEVLVSRNSPIFGFLTAKRQFRQCLAYVFLLSWSIESIPELCYAALPAYCIIANSHFLPKVHEPAICIPVAIFVLYNLYTLLEYLKTGLSFRVWWNNQRMARIAATNAYLFGVLGVLLKFLGLSETVFEVTPKDQPTDDDVSEANTEFTFNEMPLFVPGTAVLLVHITSMFTILSGLRRPVSGENGVGPLEVLCSIWVILCFWPFLKGLFRKGKYGIPLPTIFKSAALALVFVNLCWASVG